MVDLEGRYGDSVPLQNHAIAGKLVCVNLSRSFGHLLVGEPSPDVVTERLT